MRRILLPLLLSLLISVPSGAGVQPIPPGLNVTFDNGRLAVTAKEQSIRKIMTAIADKTGFELEGAELLPEDRVSMVMKPSWPEREIPNILNMAPRLNYIVVYAREGEPESGIVRVAIFPREGIGGVAAITGGFTSPAHTYTPPPPPPPVSTPPPAPQYIPPSEPPKYIPPDEPPIYIPPDEPPKYIPAAGPPVYIPPAPPPGGESN